MTFQAVPSTVRLEPVFTYDNQIVENVLHYRYEVPIDAPELLLFAQAWHTEWAATVRATQPTNAILTRIRVTDLSSEFAPGVEYIAGLPQAGSATGVGLPNNVTVAIRILTALRGRSYRGRIYHIGIRNTDVTGNLITTLFQGNLGSAYTPLLSVSTTQQYVLGVVSRYEGGVQRPTGVFTPATGLVIDRTLDSQRRRLPGRGE